MEAQVADRVANKAINESLSNRERVMIALEEFAARNGEREIYQTVDDVAARAGLVGQPSAYQALHALAVKGQIEILKETNPETNRGRIVGFKLNKLDDPKAILTNGAAKAKKEPKTLARKSQPRILGSLIHLNKYISQKVAIERARQILIDAELNPDDGLVFVTNPIAEEALGILNELVEMKKKEGDERVDKEVNRQLVPFETVES